jgi:hypothetical protein
MIADQPVKSLIKESRSVKGRILLNPFKADSDGHTTFRCMEPGCERYLDFIGAKLGRSYRTFEEAEEVSINRFVEKGLNYTLHAGNGISFMCKDCGERS